MERGGRRWLELTVKTHSLGRVKRDSIAKCDFRNICHSVFLVQIMFLIQKNSSSC